MRREFNDRIFQLSEAVAPEEVLREGMVIHHSGKLALFFLEGEVGKRIRSGIDRNGQAILHFTLADALMVPGRVEGGIFVHKGPERKVLLSGALGGFTREGKSRTLRVI